MPLVIAALRRPWTVLVLVVAIGLAAFLAIRRAPADIFPDLGIPVVYVVQPYAGMSPTQMESQLVYYYEYHFLYVAGVEHIESQSIQGVGMLKVYFHPGTDIAQALSQVTAMAFRATSFMPQGTLPPFIVRYDAGSIPVGQLVFASDTHSEAEIQDLALNQVRPLLATLPGVSAPAHAGGKVRTIVISLDPDRMRAYRLSPDQLAAAVARANVVLPAGNVRVGDETLIAATNTLVAQPRDLETVPLRLGPGPPVLLRDVARVEDSADIVYNVALVNGRRTVYMPVTKRADASTLDVVNAVKAALPRMRAVLPEDVRLSLEFDQSVYVTQSIRGLLEEGGLGAVLTALMVLLFLRDVRSALIVVVTIPFSILAATVALRLSGQTINIMSLSGLALSVGILVDESTVAIENIHTHLASQPDVGRAVVDAMREVITPRLLAMACVLAVFIPSFFMVGVSRALFPPLALAVGFAMVASFFLSSTLVPVLSVWMLRHRPSPRSEQSSLLQRARDGYAGFTTWTTRRRWFVLAAYLLLCAPGLWLATRLGTELFPRVDTGQFQLRIRAPAGTRLERTTEIVQQVDATIRREVGAQHVRITLANIGQPAWNFPVNAVYTFNAGPHEAVLLVALTLQGRPPIPALQERLRHRLASQFPGVSFSFEAGDIVSQVMNFGAPTPIDVTVAGKSLPVSRQFAERVATRLAGLGTLRDVQIPQALDYPTLQVTLDRERAGQFGVEAGAVGRSILDATSSSVLTTPLFWTDPTSGLPYRVALRVPERQIASPQDLLDLPVMTDSATRPLLGDVATATRTVQPGEIDRLNSQRAVHVTANVASADLGAAAAVVRRAVASLGPAPRGTTVAVHGQVEQMEVTLASLRTGLLLAVLVVLLLLTANFQSLREPLIVLATTPAVLAGVVVALWATDTTLNVQSMMGAVMCMGVAVANAVLLVTFARERWEAGDDQRTSAIAAAAARVRPILMTSFAMVAGMVPTALALGQGGEQTAPLGRAVVGGLVASTIATLVFLPAIYVLIARSGTARSASLDPDDPKRTSTVESLS